MAIATRLDNEPIAPFISVLVQAEFLQGALHAGGRYLREATQLLTDLQLLDVSETVAGEAARMGSKLMRTGMRVDILDLVIAATAKLQNATLVTRDTDQLRIPEIATETYS